MRQHRRSVTREDWRGSEGRGLASDAHGGWLERQGVVRDPQGQQAFARDQLVLQEPTGVTPQALSWVRANWSKVLIASVTPFIDV